MQFKASKPSNLEPHAIDLTSSSISTRPTLKCLGRKGDGEDDEDGNGSRFDHGAQRLIVSRKHYL